MMTEVQRRILRGVSASIGQFNALSGATLRLADAPPFGPRGPDLFPVMVGAEYPLRPFQVVTAIDFRDGTWVGPHHYLREVGEGILLRDIAITRAEKWGTRSYRMLVCEFSFAAIFDVRDEHGIYWNLAGGGPLNAAGLVIANVYMENIGSQAIQLAQRDHEQGFDLTGDMLPAGPLVMKDCLFRNVGSGWTGNNRASFAVSIFGRELQTPDGRYTLNVVSTEQPAFLKRVVVDCSMQTSPLGKDGATSHGAFYAGPGEKILLDSCVAMMGKTDRPVARFERRKHVVIRGGFYYASGGQAWVEFEDCERIDVSGAIGNVQLKVGRNFVGPISGGYHA